MNPPTTDELLKQLNAADTLSAFDKYRQDISKYPFITSFSEYIEKYRNDSGITSAKLIEKSQIQRNYGYQILAGTKKPGRDKVIALCLALSLPLKDTQRALTLAKTEVLYPKNPRDALLIFCINKHMSVSDTNHLLHDREEDILDI